MINRRMTREELFLAMNSTEECVYLELENLIEIKLAELHELTRRKRQIKKNVKKRIRKWSSE